MKKNSEFKSKKRTILTKRASSVIHEVLNDLGVDYVYNCTSDYVYSMYTFELPLHKLMIVEKILNSKKCEYWLFEY